MWLTPGLANKTARSCDGIAMALNEIASKSAMRTFIAGSALLRARAARVEGSKWQVRKRQAVASARESNIVNHYYNCCDIGIEGIYEIHARSSESDRNPG